MQIWLKTCLFFCHAIQKVVVNSHFAVLDRSASLYLAILICFSSQFHVIKKGNCNVLSCNSDLFLRTVGLYFPNLGLHLSLFLSQENN